MDHRVEARGGPDEALKVNSRALQSKLVRAHEGVGLQKARLVSVQLIPRRERAPDHPAARVPHRDALELSPVDRQAGHRGAVPIRIADHDPAGGLAAQPAVMQVRLRLPGRCPDVVAIKLPVLDIHPHLLDGLVPHEPLHLPKPGSEAQGLRKVRRPQAPHPLSILEALLIAQPGEQRPRLGGAQLVDQRATQRGKGVGVHQEHPLVEQVNMARVWGEAKVLGELRGFLVAAGVGHRGLLCANHETRMDPFPQSMNPRAATLRGAMAVALQHRSA